MKAYIYYVSYVHGGGDRLGFGSMEVSLKRHITSADDIMEIQEALKEKDKVIKNPIVIFFTVLRTEQ